MMARRSRGSVSVTVEGGADIVAALTNLAADLGGEALREAAEAGAEIVRAEAQLRAPRSKGPGTHPSGGHAADHLVVEVTDKPGAAEAKVGPDKDGWYLKFAETGTSKQPARPWLRPALDENREQVEAAMAGVIKRRLGRAVK